MGDLDDAGGTRKGSPKATVLPSARSRKHLPTSADRAGATRGPRRRRCRAGWIPGPRTDSAPWRRACPARLGWTAHRIDQMAAGRWQVAAGSNRWYRWQRQREAIGARREPVRPIRFPCGSRKSMLPSGCRTPSPMRLDCVSNTSIRPCRSSVRPIRFDRSSFRPASSGQMAAGRGLKYSYQRAEGSDQRDGVQSPCSTCRR